MVYEYQKEKATISKSPFSYGWKRDTQKERSQALRKNGAQEVAPRPVRSEISERIAKK